MEECLQRHFRDCAGDPSIPGPEDKALLPTFLGHSRRGCPTGGHSCKLGWNRFLASTRYHLCQHAECRALGALLPSLNFEGWSHLEPQAHDPGRDPQPARGAEPPLGRPRGGQNLGRAAGTRLQPLRTVVSAVPGKAGGGGAAPPQGGPDHPRGARRTDTEPQRIVPLKP